ncbi:type VI secretion system tube protein TssD [Hymenobacter weizhouensis]|uniref:type VI secretion system tube protein TssD n=1 Tax=Hymenobacter sp. YIM 151500-1 TaxID=2987689 RepID=UPI0022272BC1|nr:type VI secretion system tube protein TssD [Hymenobacter sp. YIM 151500-1]UYZ61407.1 HNH endonuclease [Hymenobacter sp. YIM 151500-1]
MASFSAFLHVDGRVYVVVWCQYRFHQRLGYRGRPVAKVTKGPILVEVLVTDADFSELRDWAASSTKTFSGHLVFQRPDAQATAWHVWFTRAFCTNHVEHFDSRGTSDEAALRLFLCIWPEDMGRESGLGEEWTPPAAREYAYTGRPTAVAAPAAPLVNPDIPPHLPAPVPNPSPDHKQVHLSAQEWQDVIKGRWDRSKSAKNKKFKFLQEHHMTEFHVEGDPFTYRTDGEGKVVAVYDAREQKSYNVTGTRKGLTRIPLTLNGEPTFVGTPCMYPVTGNQKNVVVIQMQGSREADFLRANQEAGLLDIVKTQGLKNNQAPDGYTWHHRADYHPSPPPHPPYGTCTMELVDEDAHADTFVHFGSCDQVNKHVGQPIYT